MESENVTEKNQKDIYILNVKLVENIRVTIQKDEKEKLLKFLAPLHSADVADLLEQISRQERQKLIKLWGHSIDGKVLSELEEGVRDEILSSLPQHLFAGIVNGLETDDAVYLVEDLKTDDRKRLLNALPETNKLVIERALKYQESTAGRLMQTEMVIAPKYWSVGQAIDFLRNATDLPLSFYDLIIVDAKVHPIGTVSLGRLMAAKRNVVLSSLMNCDFRAISVLQSQEDVAYAFNQYHMVSAPVVDSSNRLVGVITIDDAMHVLEDEAEEDMKRLGGIGDEELSDNFFGIALARFPWLVANLVTAIIASLVIAHFSDTIKSIVALAVLMPIVASMGGNAGTQTLTVAVRGIATRDLTKANTSRIIFRELFVGFTNGLAFALLVGSIGYLWFGSLGLAIILGWAMIFNMLIAGLAGILLPLGFKKLGADPAISSGVFVTTITDIVGFFALLWFATKFLV